MELTSDNVVKTMQECIARSQAQSDDTMLVEGIINDYLLVKSKLQENKKNIESMLKQLPDDFMQSKGGGMSFLNACMRADGEQWTGLHMVQENLFVLGIGVDAVVMPTPKRMWNILPGGMPYYTVKDV